MLGGGSVEDLSTSEQAGAGHPRDPGRDCARRFRAARSSSAEAPRPCQPPVAPRPQPTRDGRRQTLRPGRAFARTRPSGRCRGLDGARPALCFMPLIGHVSGRSVLSAGGSTVAAVGWGRRRAHRFGEGWRRRTQHGCAGHQDSRFEAAHCHTHLSQVHHRPVAVMRLSYWEQGRADRRCRRPPARAASPPRPFRRR